MEGEDLDKFVEEQIKKKEETEELSEEEKFKIQKEAEAKAVFDKATEDPKALVKAEISQRAINLVKTDEKFSKKIDEASENTAESAINEVEGDNRKTNNKSYYNGRKQAIESMGGNSETSTDKQKYMNAIYTAWWYIFMTILGIFFIAPLKVLLNWGLALSPEQTKETTLNGVKTIEKIKKIHWLAALFAFIFYLAYLGCLVALILWIIGIL